MPPTDRPRERLLARGPDALADRELLALLLGSGTLGTDAIELAARLIDACGGLTRMAQVARANPHALLALPGMGPAKATRVAAAFLLAQRAEDEATPERITSSADLFRAAAPLLRGLSIERVVVVVCDSAGKVLRKRCLTEGASDRSLIPVRDVLTTVLAVGGAAFGVVHNHPSGTAEPSDADCRATIRLREGAEAVGLRFLDHVIFTDKEWRRTHNSPENAALSRLCRSAETSDS
jgi:DNA repair protein RadC